MADGRQRLRRRLTAQAELAPSLPGIADERLRWALHSACFTPRAVVRQGLERIRDRLPCCPRPWVLDVGAGGGVFGQVAREVFAPELLVAVEPREEERANLLRHYDQVHTMDADEFGVFAREHWAVFDLAPSNPPWDLWADCWLAQWPLVSPGGILAMLGPSTWGHSDEASEAIDLFEAEPPTEQWRIRGRIAFNGGTAVDNRKCSWWVWVKGWPRDPDGAWRCLTLPMLSPADRCWRVRPGTEP